MFLWGCCQSLKLCFFVLTFAKFICIIQTGNIIKTRMHSSRMRTAHFPSSGGGSLRMKTPPRVQTPFLLGADPLPPGGRPLSPRCRPPWMQTLFPQLCWEANPLPLLKAGHVTSDAYWEANPPLPPITSFCEGRKNLMYE